jgi:N-acetylmuramoyl-L-alanine amidase
MKFIQGIISLIFVQIKFEKKIKGAKLHKIYYLEEMTKPEKMRFSAYNSNQIITLSTVILICYILFSAFTHPKPPYTVKKIIIDAGHGGHDPGCIGSSAREKDVTLAVALKLGKLIEENLQGVEVVYTRTKDVFVELYERANIANKNKGDLFISIHCNSACYIDKKTRKEICNQEAFGAETYVLGLHRAKEHLAVAKRENEVILKEENYQKNYDGFDPSSDEAHIIFTMYQSAFFEQSIQFASRIQHHFKEKAQRVDRGVKQAGLLVLARTAMPAVLIEIGFLTNRQEEEFLKNSENQLLVASSIFEAIKDFKGDNENSKNKSTISSDKKTINEANNTDNVVAEEKNTEKKYQNNNKTPETISKTNESSKEKKEIIFRVQLLSSPKAIATNSENFNGLSPIWEYKTDETYRYTFGEAYSLSEATTLQKTARDKGFKDAFVVAFKNGQRISVNEALKELNP